MKFSTQQNKSFLSRHKVISGGQQAEIVSRIGSRISTAVTGYLKQKGQSDLLTGYDWEFRLVDDAGVNAWWCMPGDEVVVFTGLMPEAKDQSGLAVITWAMRSSAVFARQGNERMSPGPLAAVRRGSSAAAIATKPAATQDLFITACGVGSEAGGVLLFGKKQELEAHRYVLIFAAIAGYDPN